MELKMSVAKEQKQLGNVDTTTHSLINYLQPTVDNLLKPQTRVIKASLQLNRNQELSGASKVNLISLFDRKSDAPSSLNSYPLCYQRQEIARLHITSEHPSYPYSKAITVSAEPHEKLTKTMSLLIKRYQASHLVYQNLGKSLDITGYSDEVLKLDGFIEKAASVNLPVIISGEQGSEKLSMACAIHYNSKSKDKPFIEFNCSSRDTINFESKLSQCFVRAQGGTVFLNDVDKIPPTQQALLADFLAISSFINNTSNKEAVNNRLIVSTTQPLTELVTDGHFCPSLYEKLNYLSVSIPNISQRKEDIPHIIQNIKRQNQLFAGQEFSTEAKQALCNYSWPHNYREIEQTITRLLTLSSSNPIELDDIKRFAPQVLTSTNKSNAVPLDQIDLINCLRNCNFREFDHVHNGLKKALIFIAENYLSPISLTYLSQQVHISPSHLSYLFKHHMGRTIKQIITELRISKAKEMIEQFPQTLITNIALDSGFGDLSHFEKMFKRYTQLTPREYKAQMKQRAFGLS